MVRRACRPPACTAAGNTASPDRTIHRKDTHKDTTLTGNTAVVTVTLAGAAAGLASESTSLTYSAGRWGFVPNDLSYYRHGSVKADVAAAKAAGYCASS